MTSAPDIAPGSDAGHTLAYRRDVDGLRALAVLPVVLFHFHVPGFGGGFVGVDIFFVISGFLITSILLADIGQGQFSLLRFYERRVRRIIPALVTVIAATIVAGLVFLPPRALEELGRSAAATLGFVSNVYFWRSTGDYFAGPAEMRPLLHTWSLGVEEQFYIVFPIVLALVMRAGRRWATIIALVTLIAAFAASVWLTPRFPSASFYLAPTRAWQLLAGGFLALCPIAPRSRVLAEIAAALGIGLIVWSCTAFSAESLTPGLAALAPCGGALLLIYAGQGGAVALGSRLLSLRPLVGIGLLSYSLYLWHWPVYVFLRHYILFEPLSPLFAAAGIAAAFVLAWLSWRFVEQPIRRKKIWAARPRLFAAAAAASLGLAAASGGFIAAKGLPGRYDNLAGVAFTPEPAHPEWAPYDNAKCFVVPDRDSFGGDICWLMKSETGPRAILLGDSFANHYANGFLLLRDGARASVLQYNSPRCPPLIGYDAATNPDCKPFNEAVFKVIADHRIDTVILSARWESYQGSKMKLDDIGRTVKALQDRGLKVVLVGQSPVFYFGYPDDYYLASLRGAPAQADARADNSVDPALNAELRRQAGSANFFDPTSIFCEGRRCLYRKDGLYLVADSGHFSMKGSQMAVEAMLKTPALAGG